MVLTVISHSICLASNLWKMYFTTTGKICCTACGHKPTAAAQELLDQRPWDQFLIFIRYCSWAPIHSYGDFVCFFALLMILLSDRWNSWWKTFSFFQLRGNTMLFCSSSYEFYIGTSLNFMGLFLWVKNLPIFALTSNHFWLNYSFSCQKTEKLILLPKLYFFN